MKEPHIENVPGPFYVEDGCCMACDIPFQLAPEMFSYDKEHHCYVSKQPENKSELDRIIRTLMSSEVECIRYRGTDDKVLVRLGESGAANSVDEAMPPFRPVLRSHVTFDVDDPTDAFLTTSDIADLFRQYFLSTESEYSSFKFSPLRSDGVRTVFEYSWFEDNFHDVEIRQLLLPECRWLIVTDHPFTIYDWLVADKKFCNIRWYSEEQWQSGKKWQETPW